MAPARARNARTARSEDSSKHCVMSLFVQTIDWPQIVGTAVSSCSRTLPSGGGSGSFHRVAVAQSPIEYSL